MKDYGTFQFPIVASLPAAGNASRVVFLSNAKTPYIDDGVVWRSLFTGNAAAVLDNTTSTIYGAYSLTKLRSAYEGYAIRVKRTSDSTTLDIGFVNGVYDKAAANAFGSSLKVITFYDQSGSARNLTAESGAEPVLDTTLDAMRFNDSCFPFGDLSALTAGELFVHRKIDSDPSTSSGNGQAWQFGTAATSSHIPFTNGQIYDSFGTNTRKDTGVDPTPSLTNFHVYSAYSAASDWANYLNGTLLYLTATNTVAFNTACRFGNYVSTGSNAYMLGYVKSIILMSQKATTADRAAIHAGLMA